MPSVKRRSKSGASSGPVKMGAWARAKGRAVQRGEHTGTAAYGAVMILGGLTLFAAWMGGSLGELITDTQKGIDAAVRNAGFGIKRVSVVGTDGVREEQLLDSLAVTDQDTIFSADPATLRKKALALEWVGEATVLRLWPNQIVLMVEPREPFARWRSDKTIFVTDSSGRKLLSSDPLAHPELPLIEGAGAETHARQLMESLAAAPAIAQRLGSAVFVGERRWTLKLKSGLEVWLPETNLDSALNRLEAMHAQRGILDLPMRRLDLRSGDRIYAAPAPSRAMAAETGGY